MIAAWGKVIKNLFIFSFLISGFYGYSQTHNKEFKTKISANAKLFGENLDAAYSQFHPLLEEAIILKDSLSELILLDRKCRYFYSKNQIDSLIEAADKLQNKANSYQDLYSQAMANIYLAEAYSINGLYDRALSNLEKAYAILEQDTSGKHRIFLAKANVLNSFANVYTDKGEPKKAVKKLHQVIESYNTLNNPEEINLFQYLNYSNLASLYVLYNLDSAEHFALRSIELKPEKNKDDKVMMMNYYILGKVYKENELYESALDYYHRAIGVSKEIGVELNLKEVYTSLVELYKKTEKADSAIIYENKLKELEISILQSKYNSLQKVIDKDKQKKQSNSSIWLYILGGVAILITVFFIIKKQKNKEAPQESYNTLLDLLKKNDPAFMFTFEQTFPNFSEKLLKINPQLSKSEIEFCALLKLNISTKEIAKLTFIEPRTVQNKKYRIRKRLKIPQSTDIYNWFDSLD